LLSTSVEKRDVTRTMTLRHLAAEADERIVVSKKDAAAQGVSSSFDYLTDLPYCGMSTDNLGKIYFGEMGMLGLT